ncbi:MAG: tRNA 2-thiouridine(34) synthase MnmA [PVC group bacterium]|nr:tRNA 2-thiouridine(34) synthase MnmA [PVC group bacterium]
MKKKVLVAMSGGVDSSVAAFLLKEQGYDIAGVTMCLGISDSGDSSRAQCCGVEAIEDSKTVCRKLDMPHYVLNFANELEEFVIKNFIDNYKKGYTPNPCIRCNQFLKFEKLFNYAKTLGFDYLATGHYAKIINLNEQYYLKRSKDKKKDQTYFLYCIKKDQLQSILFPLADYMKDQVRTIAKDANLPVAEKPESQDICFVNETNYKDFIKKRIGLQEEGDIVDKNGTVLGKHKGIINYTKGQRKGLGIATGKPSYVIGIDAAKNQIILGDRDDLLQKNLIASDINLLLDAFPQKGSAQIRYAHQEADCSLEYKDNILNVSFDNAQDAVTPGQAVVVYDHETVVGGGVIQ